MMEELKCFAWGDLDYYERKKIKENIIINRMEVNKANDKTKYNHNRL